MLVSVMFSPCDVLIAKHSIDNVWESPEHLLPALLAPNYILQNLSSQEKYIGASFIVIALTVREL